MILRNDVPERSESASTEVSFSTEPSGFDLRVEKLPLSEGGFAAPFAFIRVSSPTSCLAKVRRCPDHERTGNRRLVCRRRVPRTAGWPVARTVSRTHDVFHYRHEEPVQHVHDVFERHLCVQTAFPAPKDTHLQDTHLRRWKRRT
jgi:hypothetical protein